MKFSSPFLAIFPTAWWYFWKRSGPWSSHYITDLRRGGGFIRQSVTQPYRHQTPGRAMSVLQHSHSQHRCIFWSFSDRTLILALFWVIGMMSMARWRPTRTQEQWWWCLWLQWWWCWRCCWWWWWQDLQVDGWWLSREAVASYSLTSELPFASNYHLLLLSAQWTLHTALHLHQQIKKLAPSLLLQWLLE